MKTAIIISDSHGNMDGVKKLYPLFSENDFIIHLGDTSADAVKIADNFAKKTVIINGNCEFFKCGEDERVLEIEGVKIFACHGHKYGVKQTYSLLAKRAKELGCTVALYGHTHIPEIKEVDGITLVNPGTLNRYSQNTYCFMTVHGDKTTFTIVEIR